MAATFKVWIDIEEYDENTGEGTMRDAPGSAVTSFDTFEEAYAFAAGLQYFGAKLADGEMPEAIKWLMRGGA